MPHLLFEQETVNPKKRGTGKLGSQYVAARLSEDAVCTLRAVERDGLKHERWQTQNRCHPKPKDRLFPAARLGQHDTLSRQAFQRLVETVVILIGLSNLDLISVWHLYSLLLACRGMESYEPRAEHHVPVDKSSQVQPGFSWLACAHSWHNSPHSCCTVAPQLLRVSIQETQQRYYSRDTEAGGHENSRKTLLSFG